MNVSLRARARVCVCVSFFCLFVCLFVVSCCYIEPSFSWWLGTERLVWSERMWKETEREMDTEWTEYEKVGKRKRNVDRLNHRFLDAFQRRGDSERYQQFDISQSSGAGGISGNFTLG